MTTVKDVINYLKKFEDDTPVFYDDEDGEQHPLCILKMNNTILFTEGDDDE